MQMRTPCCTLAQSGLRALQSKHILFADLPRSAANSASRSGISLAVPAAPSPCSADSSEGAARARAREAAREGGREGGREGEDREGGTAPEDEMRTNDSRQFFCCVEVTLSS